MGLPRTNETKELIKLLKSAIISLPDNKFHGAEANEIYDKVDFSFTYKEQHYWLVLLREGAKVPIKAAGGARDRLKT